MGREKGTSKTGGRQKGTPNKKSLFLIDVLLANNFDLIQEFVKLYGNANSDQRMQMLLKTFEFSFPKRKSIDVELNNDQTLKPDSPEYDLNLLTLEELLELQRIKTKMAIDKL